MTYRQWRKEKKSELNRFRQGCFDAVQTLQNPVPDGCSGENEDQDRKDGSESKGANVSEPHKLVLHYRLLGQNVAPPSATPPPGQNSVSSASQ